MYVSDNKVSYYLKMQLYVSLNKGDIYSHSYLGSTMYVSDNKASYYLKIQLYVSLNKGLFSQIPREKSPLLSETYITEDKF